jgi:hypothetical protein
LAQPRVALVLGLVVPYLAVALVLPKLEPLVVLVLVAAEPHLLLMVQYPEVARRGFHIPLMHCLLRALVPALCLLCRG